MLWGMSKTALAVALGTEERMELGRWACSPGTPQQVALRCRLVLAAGDGQSDREIAFNEEVNRHTVRRWRHRVRTLGIEAVWEIGTGRGRKPVYDLAKRDAIVDATLRSRPKGQTHWSCRSMAAVQGVSKNTINRLWQLHNLKPHLHETFKLSRDPQFIEPLAKLGFWSELRSFLGRSWSMFGDGRYGMRSEQVKFLAVKEFPLDLLASLQANGRGQRQGEVDVQPRLLTLGTDGLNF